MVFMRSYFMQIPQISHHSLTLIQLNHQISALRTQLKKTTLGRVDVCFGKIDDKARQRLVETNEYWYEISAVSVNVTPQQNIVHHHVC